VFPRKCTYVHVSRARAAGFITLAVNTPPFSYLLSPGCNLSYVVGLITTVHISQQPWHPHLEHHCLPIASDHTSILATHMHTTQRAAHTTTTTTIEDPSSLEAECFSNSPSPVPPDTSSPRSGSQLILASAAHTHADSVTSHDRDGNFCGNGHHRNRDMIQPPMQQPQTQTPACPSCGQQGPHTHAWPPQSQQQQQQPPTYQRVPTPNTPPTPPGQAYPFHQQQQQELQQQPHGWFWDGEKKRLAGVTEKPDAGFH
jgi:hypothetical protein